MEYKYRVLGLLKFELKSFLGRKLFTGYPRLMEQENYLNLGCGENYVDGYINADFFTNFRFWKSKSRSLEWYLDLRFPLKCSDGAFDGIFTEHTIEHLYYEQAVKLIHELYRVLKHGGTVRITVPDLEKYISFCNGNLKSKDFSSRFKTPVSAIRNLTQNYYHQSVWDFAELKGCLKEAGFTKISKMDYGITSDAKLNLDIESRKWETLYVEAKKL